MLNSLRKSASSWLVKALLGMLVISFAIWGIGDIFQGVRNAPIAEVGDREVSAIDFQRDYINQVNALSARLGRGLTAQEVRAFGITQSVLQNTITQTAIDIHAEELGVGISDEAILSLIRQEPSFRNSEGQFEPARFQAFLRDRNLSEQAFLRLQRGELIRNQVMSALSRGAYVPDTLVEAVNRHRNDERDLKYFVVAPEAIGTVETPEESALQSYFEANKTRYRAPEYRRIGMVRLTPDTIKDTISLTDEELRTYFEANRERYERPERRKLQQLIFSDMEAAREAHEKLKNGADFVETGLAAGMTENDIELGEFTRQTLPDQTLAETAFMLGEGEFSEPVQSFSVVILKAVEVTSGETKSFGDVREEVRDALARDRAFDEIETLYRAIEDQRASGADVREAANALNLPFTEHVIARNGAAQDGEPVEGIAGNREILEMTFTGDVGVENNAVTLDDGYLFLDVLEIISERERTFEEVRDEVAAAWIEEETRKRLRAKAEELVEKGKSGAAIETLASEAGAEVKAASGLKRQTRPDELPPSAVSVGFTLPQKGLGTVQMPDGQSQAVIQLDGVREAPRLEGEEAENLRNELRRSLGVDILTQYVAGLQNSYGVSVNEEAISALINQ